MQNVAGPRGPRPTQLSTRADDSSGDGQSAFDLQPHGDRRRAPSAGGKTGEEAAFRRLGIEVKGLWVELPREGFDLRFVKRMRPAGESLTGMKVFEKEALV